MSNQNELLMRQDSQFERKGMEWWKWELFLSSPKQLGMVFNKREPGGQFMSQIENAIESLDKAKQSLEGASRSFQESAKVVPNPHSITAQGMEQKPQPFRDRRSDRLHDRAGGARSWDAWPAEPDVGRVADGVAARVDRLKALGNGQVPRVAAAAFALLADF